jgi:hypothetical protein
MSNVRRHMQRFFATLLIATFCIASVASEVGVAWATATSTRASDGHQIIYRFVSEFASGFERRSLHERVILVWRYKSATGMSAMAERQSMEHLEDLLTPQVEASGVAVLVLVSTGENLREWTYYTSSADKFLSKLNVALRSEPRFPIEVHSGPDPEWSTYEQFVRTVREQK